MAQPYIGEIEAFAFNFAPKGWMQCAGQLLPIQQNQALFSILGTTYGGNGTTNFQLPDLRGRVAVGWGTGGGSTYVIGQRLGTETVTLLPTNVPSHTHSVTAQSYTTRAGGTAAPGNTVLPGSAYAGSADVIMYGPPPANIAMAPLSVSGGNAPHANMMPYLAINYCIAISGLFPSRN